MNGAGLKRGPVPATGICILCVLAALAPSIKSSRHRSEGVPAPFIVGASATQPWSLRHLPWEPAPRTQSAGQAGNDGGFAEGQRCLKGSYNEAVRISAMSCSARGT